ncbi:MAG: trigger factor [Anaerolineae bacterium]|nr:trigger factor [Anaerolineae bacterium]
MNVQTEHLDNHTARLTVEVDASKWESAKKEAARKLAKRYRIPGFRKGKAPYNVILRYVGEPTIVEDAIESLGNEVYREALESSEVAPYAAGSLEDFKLEPPTYIFTVPLQPKAELTDYRDVRLDYEAPEITDEDVEASLESLRSQRAEVEESEEPVAIGDRVTFDVHSEFSDGEEPEAEESEAEVSEAEDSVEAAESEDAEEEHDHDHDHDDESENEIPKKGDPFIHRHDLRIDLNEGENEPVLKGFSASLAGSNVGDTVEFELEVPDEESYEGIVGRKVHFSVEVKKIEKVALPELNDDFAAQVTEEEDEPLTTLDQLRERLRENLEREATNQAEIEYANKVLDEMVEQADVAYPDVMVAEQTDDMIEDFGRNIAQQGIQLENYLQIMGMTREDLAERYHEQAEKSVARSIVLGEIISAEKVRVRAAEIDQQIDEMMAQFGEQAEALRQYLDTPQQRSAIANNLLYERVMKRISAIGQGTAPTFEEIEAEIAAQDAAPEVEEAAPEASIEEVAQSEVESTGVEASEAVAEAEVEAEDEETEEQEAEEAPADDDVEPDETDNP